MRPQPSFFLRTLAAVMLAATLAAGLPTNGLAQDTNLDPTLAGRYFDEARRTCESDGGRLWGRPLCGPMLFVDPSTRGVVANQSDAEGLLKPLGAVFVGTLPAEVNVANTAADWGGVRWLMVMTSSLPPDKYRRASLMAHELWHRAQESIGFPPSGAPNNHLDTPEGRVWLRLEWRALSAALSASGKERRRAASDALLFRAYRRSLFPRAAAEEREMEMHEGLAEYTGVRLSGSPDPARYVVDVCITQESGRETFVRSFAYASGPAYGVLLDAADAGWTRRLRKEDDLGRLLQKRMGLVSPADPGQAAAERARVYDGERLMASEAERKEGRRKLLAVYRSRLVSGPLLVIRLERMRMSFNPGNLTPLEGLGTVYPEIRVTKGGALLNSNFSDMRVRAPADALARPLRGDGWTLELNEGWSLTPGERKGDFILKKPGTDSQ